MVKFKHSVIEMPIITIDDFMSSFLVSCMVLQQCNNSCFKHVTTYVTLLDFLGNLAKDIEYLSDWNIIENNYEIEGEDACFINNMGNEATFDIDNCYLYKLFNDVHHYHQNSWHLLWASFMYT